MTTHVTSNNPSLTRTEMAMSTTAILIWVFLGRTGSALIKSSITVLTQRVKVTGVNLQRRNLECSASTSESPSKTLPIAVMAGLIPVGGRHVDEDVVTKTHIFDVTVEAPLGIKLVESSEGVVVSAVIENSGAERAGCREGDRVVATSATIGEAMWPKRTLAGVESALRSRLRLAAWADSRSKPSVTLRLERSFEGSERAMSLVRRAESVLETWDVELKKPLGLNLRERDGALVVTSVRKGGSAHDDGRIRRGDRVTMVSAAWGRGMVKCGSVEDVIQAASRRETVTLRLERIVSVGKFEPTAANTVAVAQPSLSEEQDASERLVRSAAERRVALDVGKALLAYRELASSRLPAIATASLLMERCSALCRSYAWLARSVPDGEAGQAFAVASLDALLGALAGVPFSAKFVTNAATAYSTAGRPDKAVDLYEHTASAVAANCQLATAVITAYRRLGRTSSAFNVIATQPEESEVVRSPDSRLCNALLTASARAPPKLRDLGRTERLFDAMKRPGGARDFFFGLRAAASDIVFFEPDGEPVGEPAVLADAVSYNVMVDYHARRKQPELAERTLREMRMVGHTPGRVAYTALVKAYAEARRPDDAQRVFDELEDYLRARARVKLQALDAELPADERRRRLESIAKSSVPDVAAWNTLVRSYGLLARWRDAAAVVGQMRGSGVDPNLLTYTNLAAAAMRAGQYRAALGALDELDTAYRASLELARGNDGKEDDVTSFTRHRLRPNVVAFTIMILAHAKLGDFSGALESFKRMIDYRVTPNARTYAALLEACLAADQPRAGQALALEMRRVKGLQEDIVTRTLLLKCYLLAGDDSRARKLLDSMQDAKDPKDRPNLVTYNAALNGFAKLGMTDDALRALTSALKRFTPNRATWAALLETPRADFLYAAIVQIAEANKAIAVQVYEAWLLAAAKEQATDECEDLASRRANGDLKLLSVVPDDEPRLQRLEQAARGLLSVADDDRRPSPPSRESAVAGSPARRRKPPSKDSSLHEVAADTLR